MKCEKCGGKEANFHYSIEIGGDRRELGLCAACACEVALDVPGSSWPFSGLHFPESTGAAAPRAKAPDGARCPVCGRTPAQIKGSGRMGCSNCYAHFAPLLDGFLNRLYGSARLRAGHHGKLPRSAGEPVRARRHLEELEARL
ncbi:MAG: hypothetical protein FWH06_01825, partial [Oscillospiraceae bacterium]|nr:hypothetical protein [Oscillospiraceae bacterium]